MEDKPVHIFVSYHVLMANGMQAVGNRGLTMYLPEGRVGKMVHIRAIEEMIHSQLTESGYSPKDAVVLIGWQDLPDEDIHTLPPEEQSTPYPAGLRRLK